MKRKVTYFSLKDYFCQCVCWHRLPGRRAVSKLAANHPSLCCHKRQHSGTGLTWDQMVLSGNLAAGSRGHKLETLSAKKCKM